MNSEVFFNKEAIDFFVNPQNRKQVYFQKGLETHPFEEISSRDLNMLRMELAKDPGKIESLVRAGVNELLDMCREYAACQFGSTKAGPDFINGKRNNYALTPCMLKNTGECPYKKMLCDKGRMKVGEAVLNRAEIETIKDVIAGLSEKEAAEQRCRSIHTIRKQRMMCREKLGFKTTHQLAAFGEKYL